MNTTLLQEPVGDELVDIRAKIDASLAELKRLNAEMAQDRADFDRLSIETQGMAQESRRIMARTEEILSQLEAS